MPIPRIPQILQPLNTLPSTTGGGAAGGSSGSLTGFAVPSQWQFSLWCWAAVTYGVEHFFNPASTMSQCSIASLGVGRKCCAPGVPDDRCPPAVQAVCDVKWALDDTLYKTGHLNRYALGASTFLQVQQEIATNQPLCCRIEWPDATGHFIAIGGWNLAADGTEYVDVHDSLHRSSQHPFSVLSGSYQNMGGRWSDSYFTQP